MWVVITDWSNEARIVGVLNSAPEDVPGLRQGARVEVATADVSDWLWRHGDGTEEGHETGKVLLKRGRERRK
jgi:uncharacterized protein YegJ (DUF2314 family)